MFDLPTPRRRGGGADAELCEQPRPKGPYMEGGGYPPGSIDFPAQSPSSNRAPRPLHPPFPSEFLAALGVLVVLEY